MVGEKQNLTKFVDPALELGMMSPALEVHRQSRMERALSEENQGVAARRMNERQGTKTTDAYSVMLAQQNGLRHLPSLFYAL